MSKTVLLQTIQSSMQKQFHFKQFRLACVRSLNVKKEIFQAIQFSSIWHIDRTLPGATTPRQSGPRSDGNKGVFCIPQSSSITATLPSDCLVSYLGHSLGVGRSYPSADKQPMYSTAPADWTTRLGVVLPLYREAADVFYSQLGHSLGESYNSAETQPLYSTAPTSRLGKKGIIVEEQ